MGSGGRRRVWLEAPDLGMTSVRRAIAACPQRPKGSTRRGDAGVVLTWAGGRRRVWPEASGSGMTLLGRAVAARPHRKARMKHCGGLLGDRAETLEDIGAKGWVHTPERPLSAA